MNKSTARESLTAEELRLAIGYDAATGGFIWLRTGRPAGCMDGGYLQITINRRSYMAHRLAWLYVTGAWPTGQIDHINRIRSDNRIANLRDVEPRINSQNKSLAKSRNSTGFMGVSRRSNGTFRARLKLPNNKFLFLGTFKTPDAAHAAYVNAKLVHHFGFNGDQ